MGVGCRGGGRGVESSGLAAATKLLRLLVLHAKHHLVSNPSRYLRDMKPRLSRAHGIFCCALRVRTYIAFH